MSVPDVDVVIRNDRVETGADGGDREVIEGDTIQWKMVGADADVRFRLHFRKEIETDQGPDWPFQQEDSPRGSNRSGWRRVFTGKVNVAKGRFKYSIETDSDTVPMDPMIIVGR